VVCFGRFWVRGLPFPNARHLGHPFQWKNTLPWHLGPAKSHLGLAHAYALEAGTSTTHVGTAAPGRSAERTSPGNESVGGTAADPIAHAKARTAYQDFFALWKDADPDIPILKEAKAEYAKLE
jgi:hypothetical protein